MIFFSSDNGTCSNQSLYEKWTLILIISHVQYYTRVSIINLITVISKTRHSKTPC